MYYFPLYMEFIKIQLKKMIEYRGETFWVALAEAVGYSSEFAIVWILIKKFQIIGNWGPYEVIFLYALNLLSYAIAGSFLYRVCNNLPNMVQTGTFDEVLTKPTNPFMYLTCSNFVYGYFSHATVSIVVIIICFVKLGIILTPFKIIFLIITAISGALIQGAGFLFTTVPCFWLIQSKSLSSFMYSLRNFIQYPISIYNKGIQIILTLILPYAFINFYPAQYFLAKDDFLMFHPLLQYLSPVVGAVLFIGAYRFWVTGIKHYKSTGS